MAVIDKLLIGELLVGEGNEFAPIDLIIGARIGGGVITKLSGLDINPANNPQRPAHFA